MLVKALIGALLVQVLLTFVLLYWLGIARARSARRGEVRVKDVALSSVPWPDRLKQIGNAYQNQLEVPVLFYAAALLAIVAGVVDAFVVGLAWAFVALRIVHAAIHVTHNVVIRRFQVFVAGVVVLSVMWSYIGLRVLASGSI
ncbi:MAG: MAPEG family protein [Hyphomicrobiaceae bacterium]|jgi:hypothetical protein